MYVIVPLMEKLVASSSLTNNLLFMVTLPPTVKLEFIETSPTKLAAPTTNNLLFNETSDNTDNLLLNDASEVTVILEPKETSPPTNKFLLIEMSPLANILMRSTASPVATLPAGAVKNCNSLLEESGSGKEAIILVFCATFITPPREPQELPGPYPSN